MFGIKPSAKQTSIYCLSNRLEQHSIRQFIYVYIYIYIYMYTHVCVCVCVWGGGGGGGGWRSDLQNVGHYVEPALGNHFDNPFVLRKLLNIPMGISFDGLDLIPMPRINSPRQAHEHYSVGFLVSRNYYAHYCPDHNVYIYRHYSIWWRHDIKTLSVLLTICGENPHDQRLVKWKFGIFFVVSWNKL